MNPSKATRPRQGHVRAADLVGRLTVRPAELAVLLGIGETKARELLPALPTVDLGGVRVVPIDALRRWLLERVETREPALPREVEAILESLTSASASGQDRG